MSAAVKIREYLNSEGISVTEFARRARCHQTLMHMVVNGRRRVSGDLAIKIGQLINISPLILRPDLNLKK